MRAATSASFSSPRWSWSATTRAISGAPPGRAPPGRTRACSAATSPAIRSSWSVSTSAQRRTGSYARTPSYAAQIRDAAVSRTRCGCGRGARHDREPSCRTNSRSRRPSAGSRPSRARGPAAAGRRRAAPASREERLEGALLGRGSSRAVGVGRLEQHVEVADGAQPGRDLAQRVRWRLASGPAGTPRRTRATRRAAGASRPACRGAPRDPSRRACRPRGRASARSGSAGPCARPRRRGRRRARRASCRRSGAGRSDSAVRHEPAARGPRRRGVGGGSAASALPSRRLGGSSRRPSRRVAGPRSSAGAAPSSGSIRPGTRPRACRDGRRCLDRRQRRLELRARSTAPSSGSVARTACDPVERAPRRPDQLDLELDEPVDDPAPGDGIDLVEAQLDDRVVRLRASACGAAGGS